ncbi:MAG: porin [Acidobacteriota bacterium]|nr:porin [Acidobacteriota bacterium]
MKSLKPAFIALSGFLLILLPLQRAVSQQRTPASQTAASDVEVLRRQVEEQKEQIQQLKTSLVQQSEQQEKQQHLLDSLQQRLDQLAASAPVPAAGATPGPATAPQTAAQTEQAQTEAHKPETVAAETADVKPKGVEVGIGKIKFNGLLQTWFVGGNGGVTDTFRIRRAELKFTGEISPHFKWTVMIDPAKSLSLNNTFTTVSGTTVVKDTSVNQASRILQDAFITLSYVKRVNINVGQFKVPLSLEGLQSSTQLDTERALFASDRARGGNFGDIRDVGIMLYGPLTKAVDYQLGIFNGSGESQNDLDKNDQKAVAGRLVVRPPFIRGLQLGGSGVWGNWQRADRPRRDRLGAESLFVRGPITLKGELMTGSDGAIHRRGYYGHFAYQFDPKFQGIFRADTWDPDIARENNAANATERDYVAGFNYFIRERYFKLQFNYLRKTFPSGLVPSRNVLLLNLQTWW